MAALKRGDRILFNETPTSESIKGIISHIDKNDKETPYLIKTIKGQIIFCKFDKLKKDIGNSKKSKFHKGDNVLYRASNESYSQIAKVEFPYVKYGDSICIRIKETNEIKYVNEIYLTHDLTKNIYFEKNGKAISDYEISNFVDDIVNSNKIDFHVSTHLVIDEIRARIKEQRILLNSIRIYVDDKEFIIDKDGRASNWPEILCFWETIMMRIL